MKKSNRTKSITAFSYKHLKKPHTVKQGDYYVIYECTMNNAFVVTRMCKLINAFHYLQMINRKVPYDSPRTN